MEKHRFKHVATVGSMDPPRPRFVAAKGALLSRPVVLPFKRMPWHQPFETASFNTDAARIHLNMYDVPGKYERALARADALRPAEDECVHGRLPSDVGQACSCKTTP